MNIETKDKACVAASAIAGYNTDGTHGIITNIQHFTIHDGPGIRTEVFFKGCPLRCKWCSNPEGLNPARQVGVFASRCIGLDKCGCCINACGKKTQASLFFRENMVAGINRDICTGCLKCADACPANALVVWGEQKSVDEIMLEVLADKDFYEKSGGGITVSGGEALRQWEFVMNVFKECRDHGIHTCLESALHSNPLSLDVVYPFTDLVISDIKVMDEAAHRKYTGAGNQRILKNIKKTVDMGMPLILRIPVVPDVNDNEENIRETAEFIINELGNKVQQVQLLAYRQLGIEKYETLGMEYPMAGRKLPERKVRDRAILDLVKLMTSYGVPAVAGANTN